MPPPFRLFIHVKIKSFLNETYLFTFATKSYNLVNVFSSGNVEIELFYDLIAHLCEK